jgi:hypothetical protein
MARDWKGEGSCDDQGELAEVHGKSPSVWVKKNVWCGMDSGQKEMKLK